MSCLCCVESAAIHPGSCGGGAAFLASIKRKTQSHDGIRNHRAVRQQSASRQAGQGNRTRSRTNQVAAMELRVGNRYRLGRKIGSGSFGDIYLGKEGGLLGLYLAGLWRTSGVGPGWGLLAAVPAPIPGEAGLRQPPGPHFTPAGARSALLTKNCPLI